VTKQIDWDALAAWAESDEAVARPATGQTLVGEEASRTGQELLKRYSGRPNLGQERAQGVGNSPRRQLRLPKDVNDRLDNYAAATGKTASAIMREALVAYLEAHAA